MLWIAHRVLEKKVHYRQSSHVPTPQQGIVGVKVSTPLMDHFSQAQLSLAIEHEALCPLDKKAILAQKQLHNHFVEVVLYGLT